MFFPLVTLTAAFLLQQHMPSVELSSTG